MALLGLPADMAAVRLHGPHDLRVEEVPTPGLPGPGQVLIRVGATGICGSDLHTYKDARIGEVLVITGISEADELVFKHSTVRRKGLTIRLVRRMKHVYPRAIRLLESGRVSLSDMVSHRFALSQTPEAFALNTSYGDQVVKIIIDHAAVEET